MGTKHMHLASRDMGWALDIISKSALGDIVILAATELLKRQGADVTDDSLIEVIQPWMDSVAAVRKDVRVKLSNRIRTLHKHDVQCRKDVARGPVSFANDARFQTHVPTDSEITQAINSR